MSAEPLYVSHTLTIEFVDLPLEVILERIEAIAAVTQGRLRGDQVRRRLEITSMQGIPVEYLRVESTVVQR